ncbi:hypothetical protein PSPO01_15519 [Paraphaeosphaeria sporulosa]
MSPRNTINGMIIIVIPPYLAYAGNINNMLLPTPINITATMGLSPPIITLMASFYTLWNVTILPTMRSNYSAVNTSR